MKNKYIILSLLFSGFQIGARDIFKTEIKGDKIVRGEKITEKMVGKDVFDNLVKFDRGVKALRNANTLEKVTAAFESLKESQGGLFKSYSNNLTVENIRKKNIKEVILPFQLGKTINLQLTNLFIALADLKKMPNIAEVGLQKTISSALIFIDFAKKALNLLPKVQSLISSEGENELLKSLLNNIGRFTGCSHLGSDKESFSIFNLKDNRKKSALEVAVDSGNFMFIDLIDRFVTGTCSNEIWMNILENHIKTFKINQFYGPEGSIDISGIAYTTITAGSKFKENYKQALVNFVKKVKLKHWRT